jgi:hypothetical protein
MLWTGTPNWEAAAVKSNEHLLSEWADAIQGNVSLDHVIVCGNQLARALRGLFMTKEEEEAVRLVQKDDVEAVGKELDELRTHVKWLETERHWLVRIEEAVRHGVISGEFLELENVAVQPLLVDIDIVRARKP